VGKAFGDRAPLGIRVYGGNVGAMTRSGYCGDAVRKTSVSGCSNDGSRNICNVTKEFHIS
jgi:hypothetical protein